MKQSELYCQSRYNIKQNLLKKHILLTQQYSKNMLKQAFKLFLNSYSYIHKHFSHYEEYRMKLFGANVRSILVSVCLAFFKKIT